MIAMLPQIVLILVALLGPQQSPKIGDATPLSKKAAEQLATVAVTEELDCLGFISDTLMPLDIYVAGTEQEGLVTALMERSLVYLNGSGLKSMSKGDVLRVVRAEGKIRAKMTNALIGYYYEELGNIRIESILDESATGIILKSCNVILKGDLLLSPSDRQPVEYLGKVSNGMTPFPDQGLASSIVLAEDDLQELAAGHFCHIAVGEVDGVEPGDRFTVYRMQPPFDPKDLIVTGGHSGASYEKLQRGSYETELIATLKQRLIEPRVLGDMVVVDVARTTSTAKIIHSRFEIHLGDLVIKR